MGSLIADLRPPAPSGYFADVPRSVKLLFNKGEVVRLLLRTHAVRGRVLSSTLEVVTLDHVTTAKFDDLLLPWKATEGKVDVQRSEIAAAYWESAP